MALVKSLNNHTPELGKDTFLADNATIIGDVILGCDCSVWFNAVIRGDVNKIRIGDRVNIQDGAIIHCTYQKAATTIGDNVSIGHQAIVHGCTLEKNVLIGMGAIVMDHALVRSNSIIAAGAIVLEHTVVESGTLYAGIPAKKVKDLAPDQIRQLIEDTAANYQLYASWYKD